MSPRRLLLPCLFIALGTLGALLIAEVAVRVLVPERGVSELRGLHRFRPDLPWLFELRPGAAGRLSETGDALYRINPDGLRDRQAARPKPEGVHRVVLMGDSVSFGYGVEQGEAYPQLLEQRLAELVPDARVEVVNLGVGGYNAYNEARLLEGVGRSYQPDLVLVQFCINDLNDPTVHFDAQTRVAFSAIPDAAFPDPTKRRGSRYAPSRAVALCRLSKLCTTAHDLWLATHAPEFQERELRNALALVEAGDRPEWRWLEARYAEMARVAQAEGAGFAILAFPYRVQLAGSGVHPVERKLAELARRNGWPLIDPLPAFRNALPAVLFTDWWHPTPAGHRIAADEVARAITCEGLLGTAARLRCPAPTQAAAGDE